MKKTSHYSSLAGCIGMLLLILDSKTALYGAKDGISLIISTVIPALFPFFFFSILLTSSADEDSSRLLRPLGKLCRMPQGQEMLLLPAFLGGYPAGAQAIWTAWRQQRLSKEDAERMLAFCNNAGPSFLFGIIGQMFEDVWMVWALWLIHLSGAVLASRFYAPERTTFVPVLQKQPLPFSQVLRSATAVMASVCGWLLLFRILIAFLEKWCFRMLPDVAKIFTAGMLELTNGCCALPEITDVRFRFLLCSVMLSVGGFCVFLQTRSVTEGLSLQWYWKGKALQTLHSVSAAGILMFQNGIPAIAFGCYLCYRMRKREKSSSIPLQFGV